MSSVIKINRNNVNAGIKLQNILDPDLVTSKDEDDYWKRKIAEEQQKYYNNGKADAVAELESKFAQNLLNKYAEFENLANAINDGFGEYEKSFEKLIVDLSIKIAEKIIKREVIDRTTIEESILEASQKLIGAESILIKINPSDYKLIKDSAKGLFDNENFSKVNFEQDEKISVGGCFIESEIGNVDARISTQLNELKSKLEANYLNDSL
jgi:flagellar assembly protein FliH